MDRREHIRSHFAEVGIVEYRFFDACKADSSQVTALYDRGKVASYPPCFRCGKLECGKPDCNNVLTPQQVAVFATYLELWRHVAQSGARVLVCEDDVVFHPWAGSVLEQLAARIACGDLVFTANAPTLLRLGWALGADHDAAVPFSIGNRVRMSNPCHALTAAYARELLAAFDRVAHTADVFQHQLAPISKTAAQTVFPPIASELSWSDGRLESLIHPKALHADWLEAQGRFDEADQYRQKILQHFRETAHKTPS